MDELSKSKRINTLLHQMDIWNEYDVIYHLPSRYEDLSYTEERNLLDKQKIVVSGKLSTIPLGKVIKNLSIVTFDFITDKKNYFHVRAFNRPYLIATLNLEDIFTLVGTFNKERHLIELVNIHKGYINKEQSIKPIYSLPSDYPNYLFSNLVKRSFDKLQGHIYPLVPYHFINKYRLLNKEEAIRCAHFPKSKEEIRQSLRHLKYEEALMFSLKNALIKEENKSFAKIKKEPIDLSLCQPLIDSLPYHLTSDQIKVSSEIIDDMNQSSLMYRLLQGDVGTGKTIVSFIVLYANYLRGDQGALMAPTDVLARQHYLNALTIFKDFKIKIALLVGSTPLSEKKQIYRDLEEGYIDIVIGTHALFQKSVNYSSLGLAIIDEQHRFGVNQRNLLANKGEHTDLLMMSATPIPRSLALSIYGDLDISTLYSFPNRKRKVETFIMDSMDKNIYLEVKKTIEEKRQVYIVAPLIDFSEDGKYSVEKLYKRFNLLFNDQVVLLHGKMKIDEKNMVLEQFANGSKPILVSTQVIEVGIDVKTSSLMVIYDASNFGLASLHQLRGRIGRDGHDSKCILTIDNADIEAKNKLNILATSEDGFAIAEADMKNRGPGDMIGIVQSGFPKFYFLNVINDYKIFQVARDDAREIMNNKNEKCYLYIVERAKKEITYSPVIKA